MTGEELDQLAIQYHSHAVDGRSTTGRSQGIGTPMGRNGLRREDYA